MGVSEKAFPSSSGRAPVSISEREMGACLRDAADVCLLCPILLFPYSFWSHIHINPTAFTPEVPSGEAPAPLMQSRITAALQLWQTGAALGNGGKENDFPVSTSLAVRNVGAGGGG